MAGDARTLDAAVQALYAALGIADQYVPKDTYTSQIQRAALTAHEQHQALRTCQSRLTTLLESREERESNP